MSVAYRVVLTADEIRVILAALTLYRVGDDADDVTADNLADYLTNETGVTL